MSKMPPQQKWLSKQDYSTPCDFLEAVKKKFGVKDWVWDLAADGSNRVTFERNNYFGLDDAHKRDSFKQDWTLLKGDLWLNPPYADIAPWAAKCAASATTEIIGGVAMRGRRRIFFLVPAAVGSNWFADHVDGKARVAFPRPRLSFDGKAPYPKDVLLAVFGEKPMFECWRWRS